MKVILRLVKSIFLIVFGSNMACGGDDGSWSFYVHSGDKLEKTPFSEERRIDFWTDSLLPFMRSLAEVHTGGLKRPTNNTFRYIPGTFGGYPTIEIFQEFGKENRASFQIVIIETRKGFYRPVYYRITDGTEQIAEAAGLTKNWGPWMLWVPNTYSQKTREDRYEGCPLFEYTESGPQLTDRKKHSEGGGGQPATSPESK